MLTDRIDAASPRGSIQLKDARYGSHLIQSAALRHRCPFSKIFLEKGHVCNASSRQIFIKPSKPRISRDFRPANPIKRALSKQKNACFYYGKPKLQGSRAVPASRHVSKKTRGGICLPARFNLHGPAKFKKETPSEASILLFLPTSHG